MTVTLAEISRRAGVSVSAVSDILRGRPGYNAATRQRVRAAAARLRYRPNPIARQLRGHRSGVLGVLIGAGNAPVNFDRLAQLEHTAFERGYRVLIGQVHVEQERAASYLEDFAARGVDGLIWLHQPFGSQPSVTPGTFSLVRHVLFLDKPLVDSGHSVRVDYADGIRQAVRHLHIRGRRRIGLALASRGLAGDPMAERRRGYLTEAGSDPTLIWVGDGRPQPTAEQVGQAISQLIGKRQVDAIVVSNDFWAIELIKALKRRGLRIPADVAVVGFDNLTLAQVFDPALTTVDQQHKKFACTALDLLLRSIELGTATKSRRSVTIKPRLVVRETS